MLMSGDDNNPLPLTGEPQMNITHNVGTVDRNFRIGLGVAIIALGLYFGSWWGAVGIIPLATAGLRWCPAYWPFNLSTDRH